MQIDFEPMALRKARNHVDKLTPIAPSSINSSKKENYYSSYQSTNKEGSTSLLKKLFQFLFK